MRKKGPKNTVARSGSLISSGICSARLKRPPSAEGLPQDCAQHKSSTHTLCLRCAPGPPTASCSCTLAAAAEGRDPGAARHPLPAAAAAVTHPAPAPAPGRQSPQQLQPQLPSFLLHAGARPAQQAQRALLLDLHCCLAARTGGQPSAVPPLALPALLPLPLSGSQRT